MTMNIKTETSEQTKIRKKKKNCDICDIFILSYLKIWIKQLTPWSRVPLQNLIAAHVVNKFPSFYATRRFITVFTRSRYGPLPESDRSRPTQYDYWVTHIYNKTSLTNNGDSGTRHDNQCFIVPNRPNYVQRCRYSVKPCTVTIMIAASGATISDLLGICETITE
jgi:hypothetical protein